MHEFSACSKSSLHAYQENKALSSLMHTMFSLFITNPTNQIGLSGFKELQNIASKMQSIVFRRHIWVVKRITISSKQQYFEDFFFFPFRLFFILKMAQANRRRWRRRMPEWVLKDQYLNFNAFQVAVNSTGPCQ